MREHPVAVAVTDDLRRSRLTVFFRFLLAVPHVVWLVLWTIVVWIVWVVAWIVTLVLGRLPAGLHRFFAAYVTYRAHLTAYLTFAADPFPGFAGGSGYPVDVAIAPPVRQNRWKTLFRPVLSIPTLSFWFVSWTVAILGWFVGLFLGRIGRGLRDLGVLGVGYRARVRSYVFFLTDRFPTPDPEVILESLGPPPEHPVRLVGPRDDLRLSRVTVFFRLALLIPHLVWLYLWGLLVWIAALVQWLGTLIMGRPIGVLHRFISRFVRQLVHVNEFGFLVANPFPGFTGAPGSYPLDVELPPPSRQSRLKTLFRLLLAYPALAVSGALNGLLFVDAVLTWFAALAIGRAPLGMRNLSAYAVRYLAQLYAYIFFLTDAYPNSSPLEGAAPADVLAVAALDPAA
ncbi:MAG TPA: DUF4389 domain-containing protein [Gaiellaceae bacterium]|nr:DUF4389 domain-containing protein [Gaiellaceae bacterium]